MGMGKKKAMAMTKRAARRRWVRGASVSALERWTDTSPREHVARRLRARHTHVADLLMSRQLRTREAAIGAT